MWSGRGIVSPSCRFNISAEEESINRVFVLGSYDKDGCDEGADCNGFAVLVYCCSWTWGYVKDGVEVELIPMPWFLKKLIANRFFVVKTTSSCFRPVAKFILTLSIKKK